MDFTQNTVVKVDIRREIWNFLLTVNPITSIEIFARFQTSFPFFSKTWISIFWVELFCSPAHQIVKVFLSTVHIAFELFWP